jgi:hypothetical protein
MNRLAKELLKAFPEAKIVTVKETERSRQVAREVSTYIMRLEKAHKEAANSKLFIGKLSILNSAGQNTTLPTWRSWVRDP